MSSTYHLFVIPKRKTLRFYEIFVSMLSMKTYELTYIISSALGATESDNLKKEVEDFITQNGGSITKSEKTLAQPLAYPIGKQSSGYYVMTIFQIEAKQIKPLLEKLEKETQVLRQLVVVKKPAKEVKERRTRKPQAHKPSPTASEPVRETKKTDGKLELAEMNKKLEEILSE